MIEEEEAEKHRDRRHRRGEDPLGADLRDQGRRLRHLLRPRPGARHAGQYRRGGRRDRRAVDRRAGHPADHADLPYRRRGAARCRAVSIESSVDGTVKIHNRNVVIDRRPPGRDGPQHRAGADRRCRPRARASQGALRRAPAHGRGRGRSRRAIDRRVGSLHHADHHREGRRRATMSTWSKACPCAR